MWTQGNVGNLQPLRLDKLPLERWQPYQAWKEKGLGSYSSRCSLEPAQSKGKPSPKHDRREKCQDRKRAFSHAESFQSLRHRVGHFQQEATSLSTHPVSGTLKQDTAWPRRGVHGPSAGATRADPRGTWVIPVLLSNA